MSTRQFALMNQFFPPDRAPTGVLLSELAETLRARGHEVAVICSKHRYGCATGVVAKLKEYLAYYVNARRSLFQMDPPPDAVVCMTTPPFLGLIAAALRKKKGVPFMLWCMDLYPEALAAGGLLKKGGLLYRILSLLTAGERNLASCVVTLGPDMTRLRSGSPVLELPVWSRLKPSPEDKAAARELRKKRGWKDDETVCLYSGNMGRAHRIEEFAELAGRAIPNTRFVFCGTGPSMKKWREVCADRFEWLDPVSDEELTAHLLSADVHLISQQPEWIGIVVPSKYQAACALGRPVLFAGPEDSAVAGWIREFGNGWVVPLRSEPDAEQLTRELLERMPKSKFNLAPIDQFDCDVLLGQLAERIERLPQS